jgi:hypothetical protein
MVVVPEFPFFKRCKKIRKMSEAFFLQDPQNKPKMHWLVTIQCDGFVIQ